MIMWAYARVSKEEEKLENQLQAIEAWARQNGTKVDRWFIEEPGTSGAVPPTQRPKFSEMLAAISTAEKKPDCVVAYELSRVGRTFRDTLEAVWAIEKMGVPLVTVSPRESFLASMDPGVRKLILSILTWVAERERELLIERTKAGLERAKREGKHLGRPKVFTAEEIAEMARMVERGVSIRAIAKLKGAKYATVYQYLRGFRRR